MSPYSIKPEAIERVERVLEAMLTSEGDIAFPHSAPHKLAYQIHNAIAVASNIEGYERFSKLGAKFKIRVRPGKVVCELRYREPRAIEVIEETYSVVTLREIDTPEGIVGAMIQHKAPEVLFPDAVLNEEELRTLFNWTSTSGYSILNHEDNGVTIIKSRPELDWMEWRPHESSSGA